MKWWQWWQQPRPSEFAQEWYRQGGKAEDTVDYVAADMLKRIKALEDKNETTQG